MSETKLNNFRAIDILIWNFIHTAKKVHFILFALWRAKIFSPTLGSLFSLLSLSAAGFRSGGKVLLFFA
jgi:hypothetical protein